MQESDSVSFTEVLRRKVQTGNDAQVKQAALQAIEQLERLSTQLPQVTITNPDSTHFSNDESSPLMSEDPTTEGTQMVTVTSHQLRMLRKDLREMTRQRDEAFVALQNQKEKDNRRFNDIQELQTDLNSALEQHEQLVPKFKEVLASRRELESKVQTLTKDLQRQKQNHQEMEQAVVSLLATCEGLLKDFNHESQGLQMPTVLDSILTIKAEMEEFTSKKSMTHCNGVSPWEGVFRKSGMAEGGEVLNRRSSDGLMPRPRTATPTPPSSDLSPVVDNLKLMVDQERELRRYFEAQTMKLQRMKPGNDPRRNSWTRTSSEWSPRREDSPASELQERLMIIAKIQHKDQEISELFNELEQTRTGDENLVDTLLSLEDSHPTKCSQRSHSLQQSSGDYSERLNRLQECAGMLEKQLLAVKTENKDLRIEKQHLVKRIQSASSAK